MRTVLLIDDEQVMGPLVQACLDPFDALVKQVGTAEEAIASAETVRPDAVLLDFHLKDGVKGTDLLPALRKEPSFEGVPMIAFTVHVSQRRQSLAGGFDGFVGKPFSVPELRAVLRPYLEP